MVSADDVSCSPQQRRVKVLTFSALTVQYGRPAANARRCLCSAWPSSPVRRC
jgi:hypothetical protein